MKERIIDFCGWYLLPVVMVIVVVSALSMLLGCTPKQAIKEQSKIDTVFYPVPQDRVVIADSGFQNIETMHDTVSNTDTVIVTNWKWKTITNVKNVVDTMKIVIDRPIHDTVTVKEWRGAPNWVFFIFVGVGAVLLLIVWTRK